MNIFKFGACAIAALLVVQVAPALAQGITKAPTSDEAAAGAGKARAEYDARMRIEEAKRTPRTADGKPDLSGIWYTEWYMAGTEAVREGGSLQITSAEYPAASRLPMPADGPKYKPELMAKVDYNDINQPAVDKTFHCGNPGVPRLGPPHQIFQSGDQLAFLYADKAGPVFRVIPTNAKAHRNVDPTEIGDAIAHWEGDTLVTDVTNFTDDTWIGERGYFHTDKMRVVERISRKGDVLTYQFTVYDPDVLLEPWAEKPERVILNNGAPLETPPACVENDFKNMVNMDNHRQR